MELNLNSTLSKKNRFELLSFYPVTAIIQCYLALSNRHYKFQIFTKPLQDRPTVFIEVIQRHNHQARTSS